PVPISPRVSGTVVKVLVDARLGTVLIDLTTLSPDTPRTVPSAAQQPRSHQQNLGRALSEARGACVPEPSNTAPVAHVTASAICTFGRGTCPFGRGWRPSNLSR